MNGQQNMLRLLRTPVAKCRFVQCSRTQTRRFTKESPVDFDPVKNLQLSTASLPPSPPLKQKFISQRMSTKELEQVEIGIGNHRRPERLSDWIAFWMASGLIHGPFLWGFRRRYIHPAVTFETISGVPGMVGGMARHLRSLRKMRHDYGWIHHLLDEAENERTHLMIWMRETSPSYLERLSVTFAQAAYFLAYGLCYELLPGIAHRTTAYLGEEAVWRYTLLINDIDHGKCENRKAGDIAREYYNLPEDATLRDVAVAVRMDKASHRDINHHFADRIHAGCENLHENYSPRKHFVGRKVIPVGPHGMSLERTDFVMER
ncbi:uncharacterized protein SPPG_05947 [Spizellomyces punctatus DAOM BR117]|uniref:Alternative oxidase n=1 Tax=Spizellomyces punctatus (strain DAOM BR117) TaxID=645134 RepID=A0A0L0HDB1_SPIPD|nr:uncharacterized protein SPPG_05947 [Spizellomyces punctatus DAOM BR117]KNC98996.1 hypothetical protein SPPG_05947 [Spizellomyces punctatus DAOM BR117]|eukprot:XP_016607036.1 hypothetical protein SPPG_05947 [Spizellomyces punctatus DAOM BR117]